MIGYLCFDLSHVISPMLGRIVEELILLQSCFKFLVTRAAAASESAERKVRKARSSDMQLAAWVPFVSIPLKVLLCSIVHKTDDGALLVDNDKTGTYRHQVIRSEHVLWVHLIFVGLHCQGAADLSGSKRPFGE
jgi:hypothetical protein